MIYSKLLKINFHRFHNASFAKYNVKNKLFGGKGYLQEVK